MDRKRHFPALGHVGGNSATISVSGWKMAGKAQHVIHKGVPLGRVEETTRALWFRGSPTVGDHYCHSSTAEGRHLLSAQQNFLNGGATYHIMRVFNSRLNKNMKPLESLTNFI